MKYATVLILALAACLTGCEGAKDKVKWDLTSTPTVYQEAVVRRNPPDLHVYPVSAASEPPTVLFIPFRVTQSIKDPDMIGYSISRIFWQTWAGMKVFDYMEFMGDGAPYRRDAALAYARSKGAQMVIGGFITHINPGGTVGDTTLSVQIEAHDVQSGLMVWSFSQGGLMQAPQKNDYIVMQTKTRLPSDPIQAISQALAIDTGELLRSWTRSETTSTAF